ncbi:MAG: energy transducer TonB [Sphingomicrobium sp.]
MIEEPKRSALPYAAAAIVAALAVWTIQQSSIQDSGPGDRQSSSRTQETERRDAHPAKGDMRALFSANDYPAEAQRDGEEGTVRAELTIDQRGRVRRCTIVASSSHSSLDNATCRILARRARFTPARDVNGDAVRDTVLTPPIVWRLEA